MRCTGYLVACCGFYLVSTCSVVPVIVVIVYLCIYLSIYLSVYRIKSDSATSSDCTTWLAQTRLRNFQDCATLTAQLLGLRNSACATTFDRLRNSQDCATLWSDCATRIAQLGLLKLKMITKFPPHGTST